MSVSFDIIVATAKNGVIGIDGQLPWRLSTDLRRFKELTEGKPIIMGRRTWDSLKRPLSNRANIVVTRDDRLELPGAIVVYSMEEACFRA